MSRQIMFRSVLLSASGALLLGLFACDKPDADAEKPKENAAVVVPVRTAVLEATDFTDAVKIQGILEAHENVQITAEIPGRIEGLPFKEGQRVGRRQTLVRLGARSASAQVAQAKANADLAASQLKRQRALKAKNLSTDQQVEMAAAQHASAKASLELMYANLDKAVIRSPIDGVINAVHVSRGEVANPGAPLIDIVDISSVKVVAQLPERDVSLLKEGARVDVFIDALPGQTFAGVISRVSLTANSTTRTFPIEIELANPEQQLRPGMLAYLRVTRRAFPGAVVVPRDAVVDDVDTKSVFIVSEGKARVRQVELGAVRGSHALVREGIGLGDELIILGHHQVVDGQQVSVKDKGACCNAAPEKSNEGLKAGTPGERSEAPVAKKEVGG